MAILSQTIWPIARVVLILLAHWDKRCSVSVLICAVAFTMECKVGAQVELLCYQKELLALVVACSFFTRMVSASTSVTPQASSEAQTQLGAQLINRLSESQIISCRFLKITSILSGTKLLIQNKFQETHHNRTPICWSRHRLMFTLNANLSPLPFLHSQI